MSEAITLMEQVISKILTNYRIKNIHFANRSCFLFQVLLVLTRPALSGVWRQGRFLEE